MKTMVFGGKEITPDLRMLSDLKDVIPDKEFLAKTEDYPLYYMYRDLALSKADRQAMAEHDLRYDITIIPPEMFGKEYTKTIGHYHPLVPGTRLSYTEIYEVMEGEAHYLLQKLERGEIEDVVLVKAKKGDKIIMPPNYGHITINPSNKELKMSNLVSSKFKSDYSLYKIMKGGAYYEFKDGCVKNPAYKNLPELRIVEAKKIQQIGLGKNEELYSLVKKDLSALGFLNKPQDYDWINSLY